MLCTLQALYAGGACFGFLVAQDAACLLSEARFSPVKGSAGTSKTQSRLCSWAFWLETFTQTFGPHLDLTSVNRHILEMASAKSLVAAAILGAPGADAFAATNSSQEGAVLRVERSEDRVDRWYARGRVFTISSESLEAKWVSLGDSADRKAMVEHGSGEV